MSLESGNRIADLVPTNPVGATDFVSQGDDHIRLIKACVQGSFPNLGATAVSATAEELNIMDGVTATTAELNHVDGVTSSIQTQLDAKQPLDSDLTAIAALTTTSYGRGFLNLADNAALATKVAAMAPTWSGRHKFSIGATALLGSLEMEAAGNVGPAIRCTGASANNRFWLTYAGTDGSLRESVWNDAGDSGAAYRTVFRNGVVISSITYGNAADLPDHTFYGRVLAERTIRVTGENPPTAGQGLEVHYSSNVGYLTCYDRDGAAWKDLNLRGLSVSLTASGTVKLEARSTGVLAPQVVGSSSTTLVKGQIHYITGNATLPSNFASGEWVMIVNNSGSPITITMGSGNTWYWAPAGVSARSTVTIMPVGMMMATGAGVSGNAFVSGDISGST